MTGNGRLWAYGIPIFFQLSFTSISKWKSWRRLYRAYADWGYESLLLCMNRQPKNNITSLRQLTIDADKCPIVNVMAGFFITEGLNRVDTKQNVTGMIVTPTECLSNYTKAKVSKKFPFSKSNSIGICFPQHFPYSFTDKIPYYLNCKLLPYLANQDDNDSCKYNKKMSSIFKKKPSITGVQVSKQVWSIKMKEKWRQNLYEEKVQTLKPFQ